MNPETPPAGEQPKPALNRRKFIATAAAATGATLAYLNREKLGFGPLSKVREEHATKREGLKSDYERTGELPDFAARKELILLTDLKEYMERDSDSVRMTHEEWRSRYDAFYEKVFADAATGTETAPPGIPVSPALDVLLKLKAAFQKHAGTTYNREHSALPDPVVEKRYQCRSGTLGLEMLALQVAEQEELFAAGETLVSVYTEGHVQPGLLLKGGTLVTVEMTSAGSGVRNFGKMTDIKKPIRVVRADHGTFQEALGSDAQRKKAILFETVVDRTPPLQAGERGFQKLGRFGFGDPRVPEGDIQMPDADVLPADDVFNDSRLFNRMERKESEEELLQKIPNGQEREYVRNYMVHHRTVIEYYNAHVMRFNEVENITQGNQNRKVPLQTFLAAEQEISRLADALDAYTRANNLDNQYVRAQEILARYNQTITTVAPSDVTRAIRGNLRLLKNNRKQ